MKRKLTMIGIMLAVILILVSLIGFTTDRINLVWEKKVLAGFEALMTKKDVAPVFNILMKISPFFPRKAPPRR